MPTRICPHPQISTYKSATCDLSIDYIVLDSIMAENELSDAELIAQGEALCRRDALLPGVRLLRKVSDPSLLTAEHVEFLRKGQQSEALRENLTSSIEEAGWKKQGETHGNRDFITYYKIDEGGQLLIRIDSVIEASLFVPFLATMNETDLYETWFPKWTVPRLGLYRSNRLLQPSRCEQVVQLTIDLPFPLSKREIIFWGYADEDCAVGRTSAAKLVTPDEGTFKEIPAVERSVVRMPFEADFLFRPCPDDHPALAKSKSKYPEHERKILLSCRIICDPKIPFFPKALLNFGTRTAVPGIWSMILSIAENVRNGERPAHAERIKAKREELYDWMEERASLITGLTTVTAGNEE